MLLYLLLGLAALIVVFLLIASSKPTNFRISRSTSIAAPAAVIFEQINDLHRWNAWSPWARMDPNAKNTFEGPEAGVGASFAWAGNAKVGEGRMTIEESQPAERVIMKLEFFKPFTATNVAEFALTPKGDFTVLTWSMSGKNSFIGKIMVTIMNCEKMIGGQFEQGFANLKTIVEPVAVS
jgi:hypothetical protein